MTDKPAFSRDPMTDEQTLTQIRERASKPVVSPEPHSVNDRRTLLRLLDEARADLDLMCSGVKIGQAATIKSLKAALAAVQAERNEARDLYAASSDNAARYLAERDAAISRGIKWEAERDAAEEALEKVRAASSEGKR